ncbi:hypothetical protein FF098_015705 [Parvularcula flava]|uniref:Uncharacterized protein n=1 Tax=Aquisalinus luteolus TaxID=1566827 RepID=A0A8J3A3V5_9PROT|nr:hypothetical protein [Aquisalinus luteolus]NHK29363.1 hypothetical protein [Aquisalinus luteolus]GGI01004.1 hypothetical protein GCM10011355_30620 [Aquisalinus luteolus]
MILDNIVRALRTQNWLAAGIEFIIVICGLVIGLQINAWYENHQAAEREASYLLQLDGELTAIVEELDSGREAADAYFGWIMLFFDGVENGDPEEAQKGSWGLNAITEVISVNLEPAALSELISAGELSLIRNRELRAALASIPNMQRRSDSGLEQMALVLSPIASEISLHFETRLEDVEDISKREYTTRTVQFDFEAVAQNETLLRRINYAALQNRFLADHLRRNQADVVEIRDQVRAEIERRGLG